jgi:hypothetical protein
MAQPALHSPGALHPGKARQRAELGNLALSLRTLALNLRMLALNLRALERLRREHLPGQAEMFGHHHGLRGYRGAPQHEPEFKAVGNVFDKYGVEKFPAHPHVNDRVLEHGQEFVLRPAVDVDRS